jgi:hypothetical protein
VTQASLRVRPGAGWESVACPGLCTAKPGWEAKAPTPHSLVCASATFTIQPSIEKSTEEGGICHESQHHMDRALGVLLPGLCKGARYTSWPSLEQLNGHVSLVPDRFSGFPYSGLCEVCIVCNESHHWRDGLPIGPRLSPQQGADAREPHALSDIRPPGTRGRRAVHAVCQGLVPATFSVCRRKQGSMLYLRNSETCKPGTCSRALAQGPPHAPQSVSLPGRQQIPGVGPEELHSASTEGLLPQEGTSPRGQVPCVHSGTLWQVHSRQPGSEPCEQQLCSPPSQGIQSLKWSIISLLPACGGADLPSSTLLCHFFNYLEQQGQGRMPCVPLQNQHQKSTYRWVPAFTLGRAVVCLATR